jgi:hypothetical protein
MGFGAMGVTITFKTVEHIEFGAMDGNQALTSSSGHAKLRKTK